MKHLTIIAISCLLMSCVSGRIDPRLGSENFVDGEFSNTSSFEMLSFWQMAKLMMTSDIERADWPEHLNVATDEKPLERVHGSELRVTFVNHATFLIQTGGVNILTDPVFSARTSPVSFAGPKRIHKPGIDIDDLPKIDVIVISHDHYDHLDLNSLEKLAQRDKPKLYMGLGVGARLDGLDNITELDWWDGVDVTEEFRLWFVDVQHFSGRSLTDRNSTLWGGFLFELAGRKIYFGGDSGYAGHYKKTFEKFGPVDLAFIPIGAYSPRAAFKPIHLNPSEAVQAHIDLQSKQSIGMHYGTFQLSAEPVTEPVELLEKAKLEAGVMAADFTVLDIGKPLNFSVGQR